MVILGNAPDGMEKLLRSWSARGTKALRDGNPPAHAEGPRGNLQARRRLPSFVFAERDFVDHVVDHRRRETALDDFVLAQVLNDVKLQDRVEHVVFGQRVLV